MKEFFKDVFLELKLSKWKIILFVFGLLTIFSKFLEHFVESILINNIFIYFNQSIQTDVIVLLTLIFIVYKSKKIIPSTNSFLVINFLFIFFIIYRFFSLKYTFIAFSSVNIIKYVDAVFPLYILLLYKWIGQFPNKKIDTSKPIFSEDKSINTDNDDQFDYKKYAKTISEKILIGTYEKSFAIGINGNWGAGKSSLLNLIIKNIPKDDNHLIINFNPWSSQNPQALITDFFELISSKITPHNKSIGRLTIQYAKKLIDSDEDSLISKILSGSIFTNQNESTKQISDTIDSSLRKLNKKLIITIDDIDRLNQDEIAEVFKLVRNTANFHNTIFILLYDRNYVSEAISELNNSNSDLFLEKIIQLEISLPICDTKIIKDILKNELMKHLTNLDEKTIDDATNGFISFTNNYITDWITNVRDVNRLVNSLILNYSNLEKEVEFKDFLKIEILRLKLPNIYNLIKNSQQIYLTTVEISDNRSVIEFTKVDGNNKEYLITKKANEFYSENQEKINAFLKCLFIDEHRTKRFGELSIIHPSNINRYFRYSVSDTELSEIEFSKARKKGLKEMKLKIDEWFSKGLSKVLSKKFKETYLYDGEDDRNLIIESIFYFANKPSKKYPNKSYFEGYDTYDLVSKLKLNTDVETEKHRNYFLNIINKADKIFSQETVFLFRLIEDYGNDFIFSKAELEKIFIDKIKYLIQEGEFNDRMLFDVYTFRTIKRWKEEGSGVRSSYEEPFSEIQSELKKIAESLNIDDFIQHLIKYNNRSDNESKQVDINFINNIWGDKENFLAYANNGNHMNSKYLSEFLEYFKKCEEAEFKAWIDFPFKVIPKYNSN